MYQCYPLFEWSLNTVRLNTLRYLFSFSCWFLIQKKLYGSSQWVIQGLFWFVGMKPILCVNCIFGGAMSFSLSVLLSFTFLRWLNGLVKCPVLLLVLEGSTQIQAMHLFLSSAGFCWFGYFMIWACRSWMMILYVCKAYYLLGDDPCYKSIHQCGNMRQLNWCFELPSYNSFSVWSHYLVSSPLWMSCCGLACWLIFFGFCISYK